MLTGCASFFKMSPEGEAAATGTATPAAKPTSPKAGGDKAPATKPAVADVRRDSVRTVLKARKIELGAHGAELDACLDPKVLHQWLVRAATANSIDEVFAVAS